MSRDRETKEQIRSRAAGHISKLASDVQERDERIIELTQKLNERSGEVAQLQADLRLSQSHVRKLLSASADTVSAFADEMAYGASAPMAPIPSWVGGSNPKVG